MKNLQDYFIKVPFNCSAGTIDSFQFSQLSGNELLDIE